MFSKNLVRTASLITGYCLSVVHTQNLWHHEKILNKNLNQWGAYSYEEGADVARVKVPSKADGSSLEEFSIAFEDAEDGANLVMGWDKTRVAVPISFTKM